MFYNEWLAHKKAADRAYMAGEVLGAVGAGIGGAVGDVVKKDIKEAEEDAKWRRRLGR